MSRQHIDKPFDLFLFPQTNLHRTIDENKMLSIKQLTFLLLSFSHLTIFFSSLIVLMTLVIGLADIPIGDDDLSEVHKLRLVLFAEVLSYFPTISLHWYWRNEMIYFQKKLHEGSCLSKLLIIFPLPLKDSLMSRFIFR